MEGGVDDETAGADLTAEEAALVLVLVTASTPSRPVLTPTEVAAHWAVLREWRRTRTTTTEEDR